MGALDFSLSTRLGEFRLALTHQASSPRLALLGPSGSGKTLTLKVLAGIVEAERADIHAGAQPLGRLRAERRRIGYLPQHSALLPHQTVWQQVTFGVDADPGLAAWWLEQLALADLADRLPHELSGGQQRRVALARALARNPSLILLDEPFSALDSPVRSRLYRQLRRLQHQTGLATVLVTHDPEEAALLADDIIVLQDGRPIQQGPAADVFARPASPTVAGLLAIPNTHGGTILRPGRVLTAGVQLAALTGSLPTGSRITWAVRPEAITITSSGPYRAAVLDAVMIGAIQEVTVAMGEVELTIRSTEPRTLSPGADCRIDIPAAAVSLWPAEPEDAGR